MALYDISDMTTRVRDLVLDDAGSYYSSAEVKRYLLEAQRDMAMKMKCIKLAMPFTIASARTTGHRAYSIEAVECNSIALFKILPESMGRVPVSGAIPQYWTESGSTSSGKSILFEPKPGTTYGATMYAHNPPPDYWLTFNTGSLIPVIGETLTGASSGQTGTVTGFQTTSGDWGAGNNAAGVLFFTPTTAYLFHNGEILNRTSTPVLTVTATPSYEFVIAIPYRFLAVLYAAAMCLSRDGKYDKAAQLLGMYEAEVNFHRMDKYEITPGSRDIGRINDYPSRG